MRKTLQLLILAHSLDLYSLFTGGLNPKKSNKRIAINTPNAIQFHEIPQIQIQFHERYQPP